MVILTDGFVADEGDVALRTRNASRMVVGMTVEKDTVREMVRGFAGKKGKLAETNQTSLQPQVTRAWTSSSFPDLAMVIIDVVVCQEMPPEHTFQRP